MIKMACALTGPKRLLIGIFLLSLCLLPSCRDCPTKPDVTAPSVEIIAPAPDTVISQRVAISATATDNVGVTSVTFYFDDIELGVDNETPYEYIYDLPIPFQKATGGDGPKASEHLIRVIAADEAGNLSLPDSVFVVADQTVPVLVITSPEDGLTFTDDFEITVDASDDTGVSHVTYMLDGVAFAREDTAPFSYNFVIADFAPDDAGENWTRNVLISAIATDAGAKSSEPDSIAATLIYGALPITIELTFPLSGGTFALGDTVAVEASGGQGALDVDFYLDGELIGTDNTVPYELVFDSYPFADGLDHNFHAIATDTAENSVTSEQVTATLVIPETVTLVQALAEYTSGTYNDYEFDNIVDLNPDILYTCKDELIVDYDLCLHGHGATIDFDDTGCLRFEMSPSYQPIRVDLDFCVFVQGKGTDGAHGGAVEYKGGTEGKIINNTFYDCEPVGLHIYNIGAEQYFTVINNIFYACGYGIVRSDEVDQIHRFVMKHNNSAANRKFNFGVYCGCPDNPHPLAMPPRDVNSTNLEVNPLFVLLPNPPRQMNWDLHLLPGSPCLTAGEDGERMGALGLLR